jgi:hypothetical protein
LQIETYLKFGPRFVPLDQVNDRVKDPDYVEGALVVTMSGVNLLTLETWDYVDQLWEYLIDAVASLRGTPEASFFFPDQPIEVKLRLVWGGRGIELEILRRSNSVRSSTEAVTLIESMCAAGEEFFRKMIQISPTTRKTSERLLATLGELRQSSDPLCQQS